MVNTDEIIKEFTTYSCGQDFFTFMEREIELIYAKKIIVYDTWRRHRCSLNTLKKFHQEATLSFEDINLDFIQAFNAWGFKVHKKKTNTVSGYHKDIKKYLGRAVEQEFIEKNPYQNFSFHYVDGDREVLTQTELKQLYKLFLKNSIPTQEQEVLRRFLFSCFTGLRISDTSKIESKMIINGVLTFIPHKGRQKGRLLKIPLPAVAISLLQNQEGLLFDNFSHQYINEQLKFIAARADICKRLSYHVARDTFGTIFIEMGGDVKSLKDIMGHSSIKTTMIYLKMSDTRKQMLMNNFDKFMIQ
jgi:site-specific recombinase XerD